MQILNSKCFSNPNDNVFQFSRKLEEKVFNYLVLSTFYLSLVFCSTSLLKMNEEKKFFTFLDIGFKHWQMKWSFNAFTDNLQKNSKESKDQIFCIVPKKVADFLSRFL